ncbi:MAG: TOBE domain-containing protein, partial [Desulforhabdus sp.]|nr:TOBE domain-containing protein [Desulforhabdus sp.]
ATTPGSKVFASIRPENIEVFTEPQNGENVFKGTIAHRAYLGNFLYFFVSMGGDDMIRVQVSHQLPQEEGQELYLFLNPGKCLILF